MAGNSPALMDEFGHARFPVMSPNGKKPNKVASAGTNAVTPVRGPVRLWWSFLILAALLKTTMQDAHAYSLLTHQQVVDITWKDNIEPLLLKRFPDVTKDQLRAAHAYAYGGCLIQDIGYYPLGSKFFSDLTHYVRSGDFVQNLIRESANLDEYAFALGTLAHYCSDNSGHPLINRAVSLSFPKLRARYGDAVTYAQDPKAHIRTEFAFDAVQVAKNRYTSQQYHDFIGFEVSRPVLERAFIKTYGLSLDDVLSHPDLAISTFRRAVSQLMPKLTRIAYLSSKDPLVKDKPNRNNKKFLYNLSRSEYEKEWGKDYRKPGIFSRIFAIIIRWTPKIGPLKSLEIKMPTHETEDLYLESVNKTVAEYRKQLTRELNGQLTLQNMDFDTGENPRVGEYPLADKTYARLLDELCARSVSQVKPDLKENILAFYSKGQPQLRDKRDVKRWQKIQTELATLKAVPSASVSKR
jgi:hypothetical protein